MSAIQKVIDRYGLTGVAAFYEPPISPQAVHKWANGALVPIDRCPELERKMEGAIACEELRADVNWVRVIDPDWPHPQGRPLVDHTARAISETDPEKCDKGDCHKCATTHCVERRRIYETGGLVRRKRASDCTQNKGD